MQGLAEKPSCWKAKEGPGRMASCWSQHWGQGQCAEAGYAECGLGTATLVRLDPLSQSPGGESRDGLSANPVCHVITQKSQTHSMKVCFLESSASRDAALSPCTASECVSVNKDVVPHNPDTATKPGDRQWCARSGSLCRRRAFTPVPRAARSSSPRPPRAAEVLSFPLSLLEARDGRLGPSGSVRAHRVPRYPAGSNALLPPLSFIHDLLFGRGSPRCPLSCPDSSPSSYRRFLASGSPWPPQAWGQPFVRGALLLLVAKMWMPEVPGLLGCPSFPLWRDRAGNVTLRHVLSHPRKPIRRTHDRTPGALSPADHRCPRPRVDTGCACASTSLSRYREPRAQVHACGVAHRGVHSGSLPVGVCDPLPVTTDLVCSFPRAVVTGV